MLNVYEIFPWHANFETGIPAIDEQHKKLIMLINKLAMHLAYHSSELTLEDVFRELADYATYHFITEEKLMRRYLGNNAIQLEHETYHRSFASELMRIKGNESGKPVESVFEEVLYYLCHWLALHILKSDKHMVQVLNSVRGGCTLEVAKAKADKDQADSMNIMIDTVMTMYDTLSARTLELIREINERKKAEAKLLLAASVYENTLEAIFIADSKAIIIEINPAFSHYTGYSRSEAIGKNLNAMSTELDGEDGQRIWRTIAKTGHWSGEIHNRRKDGEINAEWLTISVIRNEQGGIINYVGLFANVSQLMQRQHQLERSAHYDILTGLPNRLLLSDRLDQAISKSRRDETCFAVCYLDLDHFKAVNDTYGHAAGDTLLQEVSARIKNILREQDTLARLGGDEFVLLIEEVNHLEDCQPLLERILKEVKKPVNLGHCEACVTISIGVDFSSSGNKEAHVLLKQADRAMYRVKQSGKSNFAFFEPHADADPSAQD